MNKTTQFLVTIARIVVETAQRISVAILNNTIRTQICSNRLPFWDAPA